MSTEKNAKLRFAALYGFSLLLIFVVITAFWQKGLGARQPAAQQASGAGEYFMQFDTLLHAKLDQLDNLYTYYLKNLENGNTEATGFLNARNELSLALDSIANQASFLTHGAKKEIMEMVVSRFRASLEIRNRLINELTYLPKNATLTKVEGVAIDQSYAKTEIERLKNTLAEKEQAINLLEQKLQQQPGTGGTDNAQALKELADKNNLIASLQTQLKQKDAALLRASSQTGSNSSGDEWKQKYSSLKASYDKLIDSEKALKNAYKTVIDDNKRLIGQLQSKKG